MLNSRGHAKVSSSGEGEQLPPLLHVETLRDHLSDAQGRAQFHAFLEQRHAEESVEFYGEVLELRALQVEHQVASVCRLLFERYIAPGATRSVNVPFEIRKPIEDRIHTCQVGRDLFNAAIESVEALLERYEWYIYRRSKYYSDYLSAKMLSGRKRERSSLDLSEENSDQGRKVIRLPSLPDSPKNALDRGESSPSSSASAPSSDSSSSRKPRLHSKDLQKEKKEKEKKLSLRKEKSAELPLRSSSSRSTGTATPPDPQPPASPSNSPTPVTKTRRSSNSSKSAQ